MKLEPMTEIRCLWVRYGDGQEEVVHVMRDVCGRLVLMYATNPGCPKCLGKYRPTCGRCQGGIICELADAELSTVRRGLATVGASIVEVLGRRPAGYVSHELAERKRSLERGAKTLRRLLGELDSCIEAYRTQTPGKDADFGPTEPPDLECVQAWVSQIQCTAAGILTGEQRVLIAEEPTV